MRLQLPFSLIGTVKLNKSRWKCTAVHYAWFSQFDIIPFGSDWNTIGKINFGKCLFEFILNTVLYFASLVIHSSLVIYKRRFLSKIQRNLLRTHKNLLDFIPLFSFQFWMKNFGNTVNPRLLGETIFWVIL